MNEARRLEHLWAGEFGQQYIERNRDAYEARGTEWDDILNRWPATRVLEVGCNIGGNLCHIARHAEAWGVDINPAAVREAMATSGATGAGVAAARDLPFRDGWFDLVFTRGVLIHQPTETLVDVMAEMARCSSRWLAMAEYPSQSGAEEALPYRGQEGALFRRDYGGIFAAAFTGWTLAESWTVDETGDTVTWWVFERD